MCHSAQAKKSLTLRSILIEQVYENDDNCVTAQNLTLGC